MKLTNEELMQVNGGGYGIWVGIGTAIAFFISLIDGYLNPTKCG
jgi:lactobin A/cerein 7B family class IIb bacteriocin